MTETETPIHGDNAMRIPKGESTSPTVDFYCRTHGWVAAERRNAAITFTKDHNEASGCTPRLETVEEAKALMVALGEEHEWVSVFWDRGWGDSGQVAEISIIADGDGQNPRAFITPQVYESLRAFGVITPNHLQTMKARRLHEFVIPGDRVTVERVSDDA